MNWFGQYSLILCRNKILGMAVLIPLLVQTQILMARPTKVERREDREKFWELMAVSAKVMNDLDHDTTAHCYNTMQTFGWFAAYDKVIQKFDQSTKDLNNSVISEITNGNPLNCSQRIHMILDELIVKLSPLPVPAVVPDIERGASLYSEHCVSCHGVSGAGDGALASRLTSKLNPLKLRDGRSSLAPVHIYASILSGYESKDMPSYLDSLGQDEIWDVAFFVASMLEANESESVRRSKAQKCKESGLTFAQLTLLSDTQLLSRFQDSLCNDSVAALRLNFSEIPFDRTSDEESVFEYRKFWKATAILVSVFAFIALLFGVLYLRSRSSED